MCVRWRERERERERERKNVSSEFCDFAFGELSSLPAVFMVEEFAITPLSRRETEMLNSVSARTQPCFNQPVIGKGSEDEPSNRTMPMRERERERERVFLFFKMEH